MIQMMTTTLQAAGLAGHAVAARGTSVRVGGALRRAVGFAITGGGFAVIAVHGLRGLFGG